MVCNSKNRGRSKKTQGWSALKNRGGSLAVGSYLQRVSTPRDIYILVVGQLLKYYTLMVSIFSLMLRLSGVNLDG